MRKLLFAWAIFPLLTVSAQTNAPFNGRPWNISTGNLSVFSIQASPMGAYPRPGVLEAPPTQESLASMKKFGLVADEDYVGWGAVEPTRGHWDWKQHDQIEQALHQAGMKYVIYDWVHFPPLWLRESPSERTLMQCLEHKKEANYLSAFDPRTIDWFDHFYKAVHDHYGDKVDDIYACVMGPYGEGNYPLMVPDWVNMGHCHEGYWCADPYAIAAFQKAIREKYGRISKLNKAWGSQYHNFAEVQPPRELSNDKFVPKPEAFPTAQDKRRWLDFITWYHQAIIDFAEQSIRTVLKYYPASKVRLKPGGSAGGVNPIAWGTYCPGYARMAGKYHIVLQPADCQGAPFADKWVGTAYQFYGVPEGCEPAGELNERGFVRRMFCDASSGASQFFTYQFDMHATNMDKYVALYTGKAGDTQVAVYCPTTLYRLGADLSTTTSAGPGLRDICEFDVLDELLIGDGALKASKYKALIMFQGDIIDRPILDKLDRFQRAGGKIITVGKLDVHDVEGRPWIAPRPVMSVAPRGKDSPWRNEILPYLTGLKGVDGQLDGLWTCRRGDQVFIYNSNKMAQSTIVDGKPVEIAVDSIWVNHF